MAAAYLILTLNPSLLLGMYISVLADVFNLWLLLGVYISVLADVFICVCEVPEGYLLAGMWRSVVHQGN